jgi:hypothetical protein
MRVVTVLRACGRRMSQALGDRKNELFSRPAHCHYELQDVAGIFKGEYEHV